MTTGKVIGYFPSLVKQQEKTSLMKLLGEYTVLKPIMSSSILFHPFSTCSLPPTAVTRARDDIHRLEKLHLVMDVLDHHDTQKHDEDIKAGAVQIVCSILRSCSPFFIEKSDIIKCCCNILLQLYRCSHDRARASFCTNGFTLIINLLEVVEINYRLGKLGDSKCLLLASDVICKLLENAQVPLTKVKSRDELLSSLISNVHGACGKHAMRLSLKIIARLSEHTENKHFILAAKDLVAAINVGSRHMDQSVREEASKVLFNLTWEPKNKHKILVSIDTILTLATDDGSMMSQSHAVNTLSLLATDTSNKKYLVNYKDGKALRMLLKLASSDISHPNVSIDATKVIGYLVCRATARKVGSLPDMFTSLSSLACRSNEIAPLAAKAIHKMATYIHHNSKRTIQDQTVHILMLQTIVSISYVKSKEVLKHVTKAYLEQALFHSDRIQMIRHKGLLSALSMLTHDENNYVSECAKEVMIHLACDVAEAKDTSVEKLLRCVSVGSKDKTRPPRVYSPTSVTDDFHFEADFECCSV